MARKKVKSARGMNWLLFAGVAAGCFGLTALAYWQLSPDAATPIASTPRQLTIAAPPSVSANAPALPSNDQPAPAVPVAVSTAPEAKPASRIVVRRDPPPVTTAPAAPAPAPVRVTRNDSAVAPAVERRASAPASAAVATFTIIHDHNRGNFETDDPKGTCVGELSIFEHELRFEPRDGGDRFAASWAEVKDVGGNRFFGSGKGGFHVSVNVGGKYKNFNLAPESQEKAEAKQILDLLNSYTRRTDRAR